MKEDKNAPEDKEENKSQITYEMLTKKYISRKRKRGKKKKVQKGKKVDIEDQIVRKKKIATATSLQRNISGSAALTDILWMQAGFFP